MKKYNYIRITMVSMLLSFLLVFCDKSDSPSNPLNPSNLTMTVDSVDNKTGDVIIRAAADNTVEYQLYIGNADSPEETNVTGYFEYSFGEGEGQYYVTVRAYGQSGRYLKATRQITISEVVD